MGGQLPRRWLEAKVLEAVLALQPGPEVDAAGRQDPVAKDRGLAERAGFAVQRGQEMERIKDHLLLLK